MAVYEKDGQSYEFVSKIKDSYEIGSFMVEQILQSTEKKVKLKQLEKIKNPYAALHCLDSSLFTVYNKLIIKEEKDDDHFITKQYTDEFDQEPQLVNCDFHAPGCDLKKVHVPVIVASTSVSPDKAGSKKNSSRIRSFKSFNTNMNSPKEAKMMSASKFGPRQKSSKNDVSHAPNLGRPDDSSLHDSISGSQISGNLSINYLEKKRIKKLNQDLEKKNQEDKEIPLPVKPTEADEPDEEFKKNLAALRIYQIRKDLEKIRIRFAQQKAEKAKQKLEEMAKANQKKSGSPIDIGDMDITFDDEGQIINVLKLKGDNLYEFVKVQKVNQHVDEELTEVVPSDHMTIAREAIKAQRDQQVEDKMNDTDMSNFQAELVLHDALHHIMQKDKNGEPLLNPTKKIFNQSESQNQIIEYRTLVGEVKPTYGVRTKKQKPGELSMSKLNSNRGSLQDNSSRLMQFNHDSTQDLQSKADSVQFQENSISLSQNNLLVPNYSILSKTQKVEEDENWGASQNGYTGGGNFDENPDLKQYTIKKYQRMKDKGELSKLSKQVELEAQSKIFQSQYLAPLGHLGEYDDNFNIVENNSVILESNTGREEYTKMKIQKKIYKSQRAIGIVPRFKSQLGGYTSEVMSVASKRDSVDYKVEENEIDNLLLLNKNDVMHPKSKMRGSTDRNYQKRGAGNVKLPTIKSALRGYGSARGMLVDQSYNSQSYSRRSYDRRSGNHTQQPSPNMAYNISHGESEAYQQKRYDMEQMRLGSKSTLIKLNRDRSAHRPLNPNRLSQAQLSAGGLIQTAQSISLSKLVPAKNQNSIFASGQMGFGIKDSKELFKGASLFENASQGQMKSQKQNNFIQRGSIKLMRNNIKQSTGVEKK